MFEERSCTIGGLDASPEDFWLHMRRQHCCVRLHVERILSLLHRERHVKRPVSLHQLQAISKRLFYKRFVGRYDTRASMVSQCQEPPMKRWEGAKRQNGCHLTDLNMRFHRILLSPCCASFCLENQTKEALPTTCVEGTNPHIRESAER